ncbi:MAG: hypothetical protein AAGA58_08835 [Verrucomicrobiota bacterium]
MSKLLSQQTVGLLLAAGLFIGFGIAMIVSPETFVWELGDRLSLNRKLLSWSGGQAGGIAVLVVGLVSLAAAVRSVVSSKG